LKKDHGPNVNPELRADGSVPYLTRQVMGAFHNPAECTAVLQGLDEAGVALDKITLFEGEVGAARWTITAHGAHGWLTRLLHTFGDEQDAIRAYEEAVCSGGCVVAAAVGTPDEKRRIRDVIKANGGDQVRYYGRGTVENL
jgi:hypothetical protein